MPKSSKRKKEKVADFSKAKLKLGKGKAPASNAIDTSFKARSIALPSQSIVIEKDASEPVTKRQLTFGDLLSNLKHYNAGTRKDALLGLRELLDSNWDMVDSCLTPLLNALVRMISDEDASVRKQLLWLLAWLLPKIPSDDLVPHSSLLLLFTTSAQTHIFPEIRIDAVRSLDILLECIPETTVDGWCEKNSGHGSRILEGYLGILNAGTRYGEADGPLKATSTASVVLTPASKLVVLRSLATFLQKALSPQEAKSRGSNSFDSSFMMNAFPTSDAYHSFESLFGSCETKSIVRKWQPEVTADDEGVEIFTQSYPLLEQASGDAWTLQELELVDENAGLNGSQQGDASFVAHLAKTLHSTIIETYLDCAPSVFSPGSNPSETELQLILTVARIAQTLYHKVMHSSENVDHEHIAHLESIVNYMAPYFPASSRDSKVEPAYEEFNLIFCQLSALLIIAAATQTDAPAPPRPHQKRRATRNRPNTTPLHAEQVTRYIARRLRGEAASSAQMGVAISPAAYNALLPTVWALISSRGGTSAAEVDAVFHATLDHAVRVSSKSACKRPTIEFVGRLLMLSLDPHRESLLVSDKDADIKAKFESWYLHLPQVLWELGSTNVPCSQTILRVLLRVLQRRPKTAQAEILASLHSRLIPYFHIDHPHRGAVPGPYKKLPPLSASRVRLLALDVVSTVLAMGRQEGQDFEGLSRAVGLAVAGEDEYDYWTHISAVPCTNIKR